MKRRFPVGFAVPVLLLFLSAIPILFALVRIVQIPLGTLPNDAAYFLAVPWGHWLHSVAGATFGILGPLQFGRVLAGRFGWLHRVTGRVFVVAGGVLVVSGLRLLWAFPGSSTPLLDIARLAASIWLAVTLGVALRCILAQQFSRHRDWMIRAYAVGMGAATVALLLFPIYIITGEPPIGVASDLVFVASWVINLWIAEVVIRRLQARASNTYSAA